MGEDDALCRLSVTGTGMTMGGKTNLCDVEVAGKETPVNIGAIADIRVVAVCCCELQNLLYKALVVAGLLEEQLHNGCEDL